MSDQPARTSWLTRLLDRIDDRLSARADAAAKARGHSITRVRGSRTKAYRNDALWDMVRELNELSEEVEELDDFDEDVPAEAGEVL
jgi:hypothetical protein